MAEFIGSRISLISKSNIRYVGTLHEINSETSTVALEKVVSHGTEGRRGDPASEIAGSENVYEYIVFRGSDVKDLRIEEPASREKPAPPPDDPAILGHSHPGAGRPYPQQQDPFSPPPPQQQQYFHPPPQQYPQPPFGGPSPYGGGMYGQYPPPGPALQPPMGPGGPGVPPQHQQHRQQPQQQYQPQHQPQQQSPQAPPINQQPQQPQQTPTGPQNRAPPQAPAGPSAGRQPATPTRSTQPQKPAVQQRADEPHAAPAAKSPVVQAQQVTTGQSQDVNASPRAVQENTAQTPSRVPTGPKVRGGIVPALPLMSPGRPLASRPAATTNAAAGAPKPTSSEVISAIQDLSNKVSQATISDPAAPKVEAQTQAPGATSNASMASRSRQPGSGSFVANRGGRAGFRGNLSGTRKVDVPTTDYDFDAANAKFNKQDLVKEVIANDDEIPNPAVQVPVNGTAAAPAELNGDSPSDEVVIPPPQDFYNRGSSFFDNISCENKERAEAKAGERRGGAAFRSEEQKKNLETFGQGSVDGYGGGYRGGWRGRGRGRGYNRGRGYGYRGGANNGGYRAPQQGQNGDAATAGN